MARAPFRNRTDAGRVLARSLNRYASDTRAVVLGIARGGAPVGREVANALRAQFGVVVARKIGVPGIEEVALGAVAEGSHRVQADSVAWYLGVPARVVDRLAAREYAELERCVALYRSGLTRFDLRGRTVILVDDGLATGATMRATIRSVRNKQPARIVAAVPVASRSAAEEVRREVDDLVVVVTPARFDSVAASYDDYSPVSDDEVTGLLGHGIRRISPRVLDMSDRLGAALTRASGWASGAERTIGIPAFDTTVVADLGLPRTATAREMHYAHGVRGLVIVAHGDGSSRNSYRNRYIAGRLRLSGYSTLRVDLLTRDEQLADDKNGSFRFDLGRLATRLASVCEWVEREGVAGAHRTILVGANTGAAAALATAARRPGRIFAVVARGGRVDLARNVLSDVRTPVLLIVGGSDREALRRHTEALERLPRGAVLMKVPRAGHTFDEPGTLGVAAEYIVGWLDRLELRQRSGEKWQA
jgi:putative phosphoribosyl transferase